MLLGYCAYYVVECTIYPLPVTQELADQAFQNLQVSRKIWAHTHRYIIHHTGWLLACLHSLSGYSHSLPSSIAWSFHYRASQ